MPKQKNFTKEFEKEAVRLAQTSERPQREIAQDLGVGLSTMVRWIGRSRDQAMDGPAESAVTEDMAAELKRLRRKNEILRQEREILKLAATFSPRRGVDEVPFHRPGENRIPGVPSLQSSGR